MAENLKNLVHSINNVLNTEYNLISFDALNEEALLQILMDVFLKFNVISSKYDVGENDPEDTNKLIMECLAKIQYTDESMDIGTLRRGLVQGDKKIIYPIFEWMFENQDLILKLAYLAKFLMPLNLTPEAISIPEVMTLYSQYEIIMEEFKQVHQGHEMAVQDGKKTQELRNDSNAIEIELENVKKRIERLQVRLDKVPQQELILDAAKNLRVEKDKQKELMSQLDEQKQAMQRVVTINERLQKEYNNIRNATQGTTPKQMLESIMEEAQVLEFMVKQKLPQELTLRQTEVQILEDVINEPNIGRDYLQDLQEKFDDISKEVQKLVEAKMNDKSQQNDALGLGPFRQQAMVIARNKEIAAEELDQLLKEMKEVDNQMKEKQQKMKDTVGEVVLRGDDLKQFVNTLKAKSNVYKQQRAELGAIKAEASDLQNTLENLRAQDPSLATVSSDDDPTSLEPMFSRSDSPVESRGMTELSHLVDSLTRAVVQAREKISPMSQQLRPLRERITELKDECDSKKQSYDALNAQLSSEMAELQAEKNDIEKEVKKLEQYWQDLKMEYERQEMLLEKAKQESENSKEKKPSMINATLKETLGMQLKEQENIHSKLKNQLSHLHSTKEDRKKQIELWTDLGDLFELKKRCLLELKEKETEERGKFTTIDSVAETFTLQ